MLLSQWLCNFLPVPFLPQAILSTFLFLQSTDVRLNLLILGNLLYMPAAANQDISGRIYKAEARLFPSYKVISFWGIPSTSSFLCQVSHSKTCSSFLPTRYILNNFQFKLVSLWHDESFFSAHSHSFYFKCFSACPFFLLSQHVFSSKGSIGSIKYSSVLMMLMQVKEDLGNAIAQCCTRAAFHLRGSDKSCTLLLNG